MGFFHEQGDSKPGCQVDMTSVSKKQSQNHSKNQFIDYKPNRSQ